MWVLNVKLISWPWAQCPFTYKNLKTCFSSETTGPIKAKILYVSFSGTRKWKFIDMMLVHMTKMAVHTPFMVKPPSKNLLLRKPVYQFSMKTWYVALVTPAHHSFNSNDDPGMTLGPILRQGENLVTKAFLLEKVKNCWFFQNYCRAAPRGPSGLRWLISLSPLTIRSSHRCGLVWVSSPTCVTSEDKSSFYLRVWLGGFFPGYSRFFAPPSDWLVSILVK